MALSTYSDLQASVVNWLGRDGDASIAAVVADAIALTEAKLNRVLRVGPMEASTTLTGTNGVFSLPADFVTWRRVSDATYGPLEFAEPNWADAQYPTNVSGAPRFFTVIGSTLTTYPATASTLDLDYYQSIPALSDSNTANWLLTGHPDVYLFGALVELNAFAKSPDAAALWAQRFGAALEEIRSQDTSRRYARSVTRYKGPTP